MGEIDFLERLRRRVPAVARSGVVLGIGDDCAILRPRGSAEDLLFTTDMSVEDVHFRRSYPAESVGRRALARGLSDIAAMGGEPRFCLLSLAVAPWAGQAWVDRFFGGLLKLAREAGTVLAGGDLARAAAVTADIVVCGAVPRGKALRRDGASPGDVIYVSGDLGGAALGLASGAGAAWRRHLRPEPRLSLGRFVRTRLRATAAMDLSDGLSIDLARLCLASGVAAQLDAEPPRFRGASLEQALHGGEDYELLFTVRPGTAVPAEREGVRLTRIGAVREGRPGGVTLLGSPLPRAGYDHFGSAAP